MSSTRLGSILQSAAVGCAVIVTTLLVRRELFPSQSTTGSAGGRIDWETPFDKVDDWASLANHGHRMGASLPEVTLLVFSDFECPACRTFEAGALRGVRSLYPEKLAVVFRHFPLDFHRLAYPAAHASECAGAQGAFGRFQALLFRKQDSLGLIPFEVLGAESGVPDLKAFSACFRAPGRDSLVDADIEAAIALGLNATPTVFIDGERLPGVPDSARLAALVRARLDRR